MNGYIATLPKWFIMMIIVVIIAAIIYKFIKAERIKAGPVEIDDIDDNNSSGDVQKQKKVSENVDRPG